MVEAAHSLGLARFEVCSAAVNREEWALFWPGYRLTLSRMKATEHEL